MTLVHAKEKKVTSGPKAHDVNKSVVDVMSSLLSRMGSYNLRSFCENMDMLVLHYRASDDTTRVFFKPRCPIYATGSTKKTRQIVEGLYGVGDCKIISSGDSDTDLENDNDEDQRDSSYRIIDFDILKKKKNSRRKSQ